MTQAAGYELLLRVIICDGTGQRVGHPGFYGQILDFDMGVSGDSIKEVVARLHEMVGALVSDDVDNGRAPLGDFPKAPKRWWDLWEQARRLRPIEGPLTLPPLAVPPAYMIPKLDSIRLASGLSAFAC